MKHIPRIYYIYEIIGLNEFTAAKGLRTTNKKLRKLLKYVTTGCLI